MAGSLTIHLHRAMRHAPRCTATIFNERRVSYAELGQRVARLAGGLKLLGVDRDDRVALLSLNCDRYLESQLAVFWAGAAVNPVNTRWSEKEILFSLDDCAATILLVDEAFCAMGIRLRASASTLRHVIYMGDGATPSGMHAYEDLVRDSAPIEDAFRCDDDLAGIFYTGGTTGFPKGVMLSHGSIGAAVINRIAADQGPGAISLHAAPLFHLAGALGMWSQLAKGGTHVFLPSFEPRAAMALIEREQVTDTLIVPTMIQMILDHPQRADFNLASFKHVVYGGAPISPALQDRLMEALPDLRLMQGFGMTELSGCVTFLPARYHGRQACHPDRLGSAGYAAVMSEVAVVDAAGEELPRGQVGEIVARGATAMLGYWNRPADMAATVRKGWIHTGDLAYMDDEGFIYIVDRVKDMIVSGGENVYSAEVEKAIASHPYVAQCAVIGIPDERWGESVHAVVVLHQHVQLVAAELIDHCKTLIAGYKCPRSVDFACELPMSAAGKLQKHLLREQFWKQHVRKVN
ncbi:long-chain fatty acid--CoA ligase [Janthinobacterium sp. PC23-8]|uniref:acyl-CoA synthetase n=1 Tax=Janthinobacterium sp. PC23-8 TaxID=2012679 RepID=UPI000B963BFD|nr:long-chain fatty acid--CoA ligase [Janthinobacterium sp. PC23-8]OYO26330.1 fatty-acid--CoA ligase [Janthinobacterium sp. PC23-8]